MSPPQGPGSSQAIKSLLERGHTGRARDLAALSIADSFDLKVSSVDFRLDAYSLNSVSGLVTLEGGQVRFFKFHSESGEADHVGEYYRAGVLAEAGLPVEVPLASRGDAGWQLALYELRTEPRLADVCLDLEMAHGAEASMDGTLLAARAELDAKIGEVAVATLAPGTAASAEASIHQLFWHRLTDRDGRYPGGRFADFYTANGCWQHLAGLRWRINGVSYDRTLGDIFEEASRLLDPRALARGPVLTAHGDDHQGNIWVLGAGDDLRLTMFDPAFAGTDIPALLAPVKATFHNALAHPFWLYHPAVAAERIEVSVRSDNGVVDFCDDAGMSPLRRSILASVSGSVWIPLLRQMADQGRLPAGWRRSVRAALAACPLLVTNLLSAERPEPIRWLGLARTVVAGAEPLDGTDVISEFLDRIAP